MLGHARRDLLAASTNLDIARKCGFPEATAIKMLYHALDRAWELECMARARISTDNFETFQIMARMGLPNPFTA
jgi:hypothetical protein